MSSYTSSNTQSAMSADVSSFPGEHRHGRDSAPYVRIDVEQVGIDLAAIEYAVKELPLFLRQIEQEGKPFPAERNGLLDPRLDFSHAGEAAVRQANAQLLAKLAGVTFYGPGRDGPPVEPAQAPMVRTAALIQRQSRLSIDRMRRASNRSRAACRSMSATTFPATTS